MKKSGVKKYLVVLLFISCRSIPAMTQETTGISEEQLELAGIKSENEQEVEDDTFLQQLERFQKNRINLNSAGEPELQELRILSEWQIESLIKYRQLFGRLIDVHELQAIPGWDIQTIKKLLPFISVASPALTKESWSARWMSGEHQILLRVAAQPERSDGLGGHGEARVYPGSSLRLYVRYKYAYRNLLQFGVVGEKDAGERFLGGRQRYGFDFYSFHLFARNMGNIRALALGDFTVSLGQGLIQWQGPAFGKTSDITAIKRQSPVLRPYNSAGEVFFYRGVGITVAKGNTETSLFVSSRKLDASTSIDSSGRDIITSFVTSGYHRTELELEKKNRVGQLVMGGRIRLQWSRLRCSVNGVYYHYSLPIQKRDEPYNLYAIRGQQWWNASTDYSYTWKNIHLFGEVAIDKLFNHALINGMLMTLDPKVDFSIVYRSLQPAYQSLNSNAFTENTLPSNENGLYGGITWRPGKGWKIDMYMDQYAFPWLKYGVDAPGRGGDYLVQVQYQPGRAVELITRFRQRSKQVSNAENLSATKISETTQQENWRFQLNWNCSKAFTIRARMEKVAAGSGNQAQRGYLELLDLLFKPMTLPFSIVVRIQYFETDGYDARLYAYENDVMYSYSIPAWFGKGFRYYLSGSYDINRRLTGWVKLGQSLYPDNEVIGSGADQVRNSHKSEIKLQFRYNF